MPEMMPNEQDQAIEGLLLIVLVILAIAVLWWWMR
jgi:hypothetical protein